MDRVVDRDHLKYFNHGLVSKSEINSFFYFIQNNIDNTEEILKLREHVIKNNSHNVLLYNLLNFFLKKATKKDIISTKNIKNKIERDITNSERDITNIASRKIISGSNVLVYSINNTIFEVLKKVSKYKKINLFMFSDTFFNWEKKLAQIIDINTKFFHPFELDKAIDNSDICLFGSDMLFTNGVVSHTGTKVLFNNAKEKGVPVYFCSPLLKYDLNNRKFFVLNNSFDNKQLYETISDKKITGIITENGIFKTKHLKSEAEYKFRYLI